MLLPKPQSLALVAGLSLLSFHAIGQGSFSDSSRISASVTSLNAEHLEFSPVFYDNGLLFVTSQKKNKKNKRYFDIAYAPFLQDGQLGAPVVFEKLNTKYHEGPLAVKNDLKSAFVTRSSLENGKPIVDSLGFNRLGIYEVSLSENNKFTQKLSFNGIDFSCVHPTLSQDETRLYFSSDRPGGFGGFDIWYSEKKKDTWGEPVNLGEKVNTASNEIFPIIFQDETLFFTSDRPYQGIVKGLDVYQYGLGSLESNLATRLPSPINSDQDDFGLILDASKESGYFASNRAGSDDIYRYDIKEPLPPKRIQFSMTYLENLPLSAGLYQHQPVASANISLTSKDEQLKVVTDKKGRVDISIASKTKYEVIFSKERYVTDTMIIWDSLDLVKTTFVQTKKRPCKSYQGTVVGMDGVHGMEGVKLTILPNIAKSEKLTAISNADGVYSFCLPFGCTYYEIHAEKLGYMPYNVRVKVGQEIPFSLIPIEQNTMKASFVLENIYYDFNDSKIRENSTDELVRLAQILKEHPSIKILLVAYTDSRGAKKYNERLARHRARAAKAFLVSLGVDSDRIKPVGRGEVNIRNRCKNGVKCSEEEHRYNRRTEVVFRNKSDNIQLIYNNSTSSY